MIVNSKIVAKPVNVEIFGALSDEQSSELLDILNAPSAEKILEYQVLSQDQINCLLEIKPTIEIKAQVIEQNGITGPVNAKDRINFTLPDRGI